MRDILVGIDHITVSVGVDAGQAEGARLRDILFRADSALHRAKSQGGNRCTVYEFDLPVVAQENPGLEHDLRGAWERGEIFLLYQPQIDLASGRIFGVEALARWKHPIYGLIMPQTFIALAESSRLICSMGAWILDEACRQAQLWRSAGLMDAAVSVNVSPVQLNEESFVEIAKNSLIKSSLPPEKLVLEVTESVMLSGGDRGVQTLREIREAGIKIAIDDFGLGYSSLSYLRSLPADFLKIDRSFVSDLPQSKDAEAIARAIIGMGRSLGMRIIAEGIETQDQADLLQSIWCDDGQGYLYARPLTSEKLEDWATEWNHSVGEARQDAAASVGMRYE